MIKWRPNFRGFSIGVTWFWLAFFALVPAFLMLVTSLVQQGDNELVRLQLTFANYGYLLNNIYIKIFWRSFEIAFLVTAICLVLGYPVAYFVARLSERFRNLLLLLIIIPFWTSSLIRTYAIVILLKAKGILNGLLLWFGIIHQPLQWLYTDTAAIIGLVYTLLPFMILPLYSAVEKLDSRLIDAAKDLGASSWQIFSRILIPLTMPGIIAGCMLVFLPAMSLFYIPNILGGAKTMLVGNLIENQFLAARNWPLGASISIILSLLMGLMLFAYVKSQGKITDQHGPSEIL